MFVACPHCGSQLQNDPALSGQHVACPSCANQFRMPIAIVPTAQSFAPSGTYPGHSDVPNGITVPLLISAISNIVVGLIWLGTCIGVAFAIPMAILAIFEFILYSRIGREPVANIARSASTLAIFEIIVGLFNTPTLICGIILMINAGKVRRTGSAGPSQVTVAFPGQQPAQPILQNSGGPPAASNPAPSAAVPPAASYSAPTRRLPPAGQSPPHRRLRLLSPGGSYGRCRLEDNRLGYNGIASHHSKKRKDRFSRFTLTAWAFKTQPQMTGLRLKICSGWHEPV